jgi:hypothetical protein
MNTTQSKNITSPQNNFEFQSTSMHRVQQRRSRVPIYTKCEGDDLDLWGDDGGNDDVAIDDEDDTSPHAKGVPVMIKVSNSPRRRPRSSMIIPLLENKKTITSADVSENSIKIRESFFPRYEGLIKRRRGVNTRGWKWAPPCGQEVEPCGGPSFGPTAASHLSLVLRLLFPMKNSFSKGSRFIWLC